MSASAKTAVDKQVLTMTMPDGATSTMSIYTRSTANKQPIRPDEPVILMHCALGVQASYYQPFAEAFASQGYIFLIAESRGVGTSSIRPSRKTDWGHFYMIEHDLPVHFTTLRSIYPSNPLFLFGHSLGGHLQVLYLSLQLKRGDLRYLKEVKGLIFVCSGSVYWRQFGVSLYFISYLICFVSWLLGWWPGKWFGFGGTAASTLMRNWVYEVQHGRWLLTGSPYPDLDDQISKIDIPSYFLSIDGDRYTTRSSAARLKDKLAASTSTHEHYRTEELQLPWKGPEVHFRWARKSEVVAEKVHDWIQALDKPRSE